MAAVGDWSALTLCVHGDVVGEYGKALELTDETIEANQQADVTTAIAKAQEIIGRMLDASLEQYYGINLGSYTAAEDLKDHLANPEVLKYACIAKTLEVLFRDNVLSEGDFNHVREKRFEKEFKKEYTIAVGKLRFDKDDDGDISDEELASKMGSNRIVRV